MNRPHDYPSIASIGWPSEPHVLPREIFDREDVYQAEVDRIFKGPVWIPVAHDSEFPGPHDFKTSEIAGVAIVITRDGDGRVHAFRNACTHRGTQLLTQHRGHAQAIECPYHRWVFDSKGALQACPGEADFHEDFRRDEFALRRIRLETVLGLHFATLHVDTPPLREFLGREVIRTMTPVLGGDGRLNLLGYQKVIFNANWKAYMDNDGWHAPMLHTAFRLLDWTAGKGGIVCTESGHRCIEYEINPSKNLEFLKDPTLLDYGPSSGRRGVIPNLFPITNMSNQLDIMTLRYAWPRGVDKTEVHWTYFSHQDDDAAMLNHRIRQSANLLGPSGMINLEDGAVFNRLQNAAATGGDNFFLKGVHGHSDPYTESTQNDELSNIVWWNAYRRMMGF